MTVIMVDGFDPPYRERDDAGYHRTYVIQVDHSHDFGEVESIICQLCRRQSYNPTDIIMKYCANCNLMHETGRSRTDADIQRADIIGRDVALMGTFNEIMTFSEKVNWLRDGF